MKRATRRVHVLPLHPPPPSPVISTPPPPSGLSSSLKPRESPQALEPSSTEPEAQGVPEKYVQEGGRPGSEGGRQGRPFFPRESGNANDHLLLG